MNPPVQNDPTTNDGNTDPNLSGDHTNQEVRNLPSPVSKRIIILIGLVVVLTGIATGVSLVQQRQELRRSAAGEYGWNGTCYTNTGGRDVYLYRCSPSEYTSGACNLHPVKSNCFDMSFCGYMQLDVACWPSNDSDSTCDQNEFASTQFIDNTSACQFSPPQTNQPTQSPKCDSPCTTNSDCQGPGMINPICSYGRCYDAQACGQESGGGTSRGPCGSSCTPGANQCTSGSQCYKVSTDDQGNASYRCVNPYCIHNPGACSIDMCTALMDCSSDYTDCRIGNSVCSGGTCDQSTGKCICGTPAPIAAQCLTVKAYNTSWVQLTPSQLNTLKPGDKVRFAVSGNATSGTFDKAVFTINGVRRTEVTTKRPNSNDFYDEYTVPSGATDYTLSVGAQLHHLELNQWF